MTTASRAITAPAFPYTAQQRTHFELRRRGKLELFDIVQNLYARGMRASEIVRQTGVCRHRVDKWIRVRELPERSRMAPKSGMPGFYYEYLAKRSGEGCQNVRILLAEIHDLGYRGCYSWLARVLSPWRASGAAGMQSAIRTAGPTTLVPTHRISPKIAASLLMKIPEALSARQRHIIDHLKERCPGFATAPISPGFPHDPAERYTGEFTRVDAPGPTVWHGCPETLCEESGAGLPSGCCCRDYKLEQWPDRGAYQSFESNQTSHVRAGRRGAASCPTAAQSRL